MSTNGRLEARSARPAPGRAGTITFAAGPDVGATTTCVQTFAGDFSQFPAFVVQIDASGSSEARIDRLTHP